ncbi:hypothetical protein M5689_006742 [Euphorbia peplus]|nr:hypothetical protein M5689_006742 [Euphorbia peplus]
MDNHHLSQPLLNHHQHSTNSYKISQSSNSTIIIRLSTFFFIAIISIWANFVASSPFQITILNHIHVSLANTRFTIFYISDDNGLRIIQNSSSFIHNILYPNTHNAPLSHLILRLATADAAGITVKTEGNSHHLHVNLTVTQIMGDLKKLDYAFKSMVFEGMARVLVLHGRAPPWIVDGVVEYIKRVGGYGIGDDDDDDWTELFTAGEGNKKPRAVARFLQHCESLRKGFIQRLIGGLRDGWDDRTVENALKLPIHNNVCDNITYIFNQHSSSN